MLTYKMTASNGQAVQNGTDLCVVPAPIRRYMTVTEFTPETIAENCDWSAENYYPIEITVQVNEPAEDGTRLYLAASCGLVRTCPLASDGTCIVSNLLCGQAYTAFLQTADGETVSDTVRFTTANEYPRTVRIPGTNNTRDIGGRLTADGTHRVRQGMVYRGANLRGVDKEGLRVMTEELGIRTELDVTGGSESSDAAGEVLQRAFLSIKWYQLIFAYPDFFEALRDAVKLFADRNNYPVYVHCSLGRDRTGAIAWILNGLCGVPPVDLQREHYLTFFSLRGDAENAGVAAHIANITAMTAGFFENGQEGDTMQTCIENFLRKIGVTDAEMDAIRENLLETV